MKLAALGASAIALTLALTPPAKALDNVTRDYVALSTAAIWVTVACPGYEMDDLRKAADLRGTSWQVELLALDYDWASALARALANGRPEWAKALSLGCVDPLGGNWTSAFDAVDGSFTGT